MGYRTSPVRVARLALLAYLLMIIAPSHLLAQDLVSVSPSEAIEQDPPTLWLPLVSGGSTAQPPIDSIIERDEAARLYRELFLPAMATSPDFSGDTDSCSTGAIGQKRSNALLAQINYFRMMAGVAPVTQDAGMSQLAQSAALVMAANDLLTHTPEPFLRCYSTDALRGAALSNLSRRAVLNGEAWPAFPSSPTTIMDQMDDDGPDNFDVAHRYWLLHPLAERAGIGEAYARHAVMRLDESTGTMAPVHLAGAYGATYIVDPAVDYNLPWDWISWPPAGHVPRQVVYDRWSMHFPDGTRLEDATVSMWLDGAPIEVTVVHKGEEKQTLVWEPLIDLDVLGWDTEHTVRVVVGSVGEFVIGYEIILFDANE